MQSMVAIARDNKCTCKITGLKHTRSCNQREYRLRLKLKSLRVDDRVHEHILVNGDIVRCKLQRSKLGTLCSLCGFSVSKLASERVRSDLVAFGIL